MAQAWARENGSPNASFLPSGANPGGTSLGQIPGDTLQQSGALGYLTGSGGGSGGAGGGGAYNNLTDPSVLASLGLEQQGLGQLDAALKSARERAIIGFGDPSLASEAGFGLDPQAGAFAQQNYLSGNSTLSRLDKQHNLAHQAVINQLASHGILNSGDLGYQEGQADQSYGNQVYDAKQQVLDYLSSLLSNYNTQQQQLKQATITARQNAIANFLSNPSAYTQAFGG